MTARKDCEAGAPMHTPPDGVSFHPLPFAESLQLEPDPGQSLHVVPARGRGTRLQVPAGWLSLCLPLSARLRFESAARCWELPTGRHGSESCRARLVQAV